MRICINMLLMRNTSIKEWNKHLKSLYTSRLSVNLVGNQLMAWTDIKCISDTALSWDI